MNTLTNRLRAGALGITLATTCVAAWPAYAQAGSAKLDEALKITDELQTDVSFRTNDASINAPSMSPLLKLGALAASMPDVKVRVAGYADPRGSDEVNDALSQRRAEAVAAVLANAG